MRILITGANGFVGNNLVRQLLKDNFQIIATGRGENRLNIQADFRFQYCQLDFTDKIQVQQVIDQYQPDCIVHAGAMSRPDECEENKEKAFSINVSGTENLLQASEKRKPFFIFLSTDFIFSGNKLLLKEEEESGPVNYYGETKVLAESLVQQFQGEYAIIRTILVYGKPLSGRSNILTVVKEKLEKGEAYHVYGDQIRTPTYIDDLVNALVTVIKNRATGVFHIGGKDLLTPFQMAEKVAAYFGLDRSLLIKETRASFSQPALRPLLTGFDISKAKQELNYEPISFEEGLKKTFS